MRQLPEDIERLQGQREQVVLRHKLLRSIRDFFDHDGFIETDTPVVVSAPAPEEHIEAPKLASGFLRTSPELQMKRIVTAGYERIYQIGPCFRQGELGRLHNPEFTMLEWYQRGIDYRQLLDFTRNMLRYAVNQVCGTGVCEFRNAKIDFNPDWEVITVHDAFSRFAGVSPEDALREDCFEETLVDKVEPNLGFSTPTVLIDYPSELAALARRKKHEPELAERWELYMAGIEIANAYSELTDPEEQRQRFVKFAESRSRNGYQQYPEPTAFLDALAYGMPECAGCALGIDRLVMILSGSQFIHDVILPE